MIETKSVTFRPYRAGDHDAVIALDRLVMMPMGIDRPIDHPRRADLRDIEDHYRPPAGAFLVGMAGPRIAAMGGFLKEQAGVARLKRVRVDPDFRRRGLASRLVRLLECRARDAGYGELMLHVTEHQAAALALYPCLGYKRAGDRPGDQGHDFYFRKVLAKDPGERLGEPS